MRRSLLPILLIISVFVIAPPLVRNLLRGELPDAMMVIRESPVELNKFAFSDHAGRNLSLEDFRGRTLLVNIWATWCAPCREEMAALDRLAAMPIGKKMQIVPISIDLNGIPSVLAFYERLGLGNLPAYVDPSENIIDALGIVGIPTTLLIDPDGREIGRMHGPAKWDSEESIRYLDRFISL